MTKYIAIGNEQSADRNQATEGFTLVELLVVLAIIGLVAALVAPQVLKYLGSAKVETTKAQIKNIENAIELYYIDVGRYPTTEEGLTVLTQTPSDRSVWNGPYLKKSGVILDAWGTAYQYKSPAEDRPYEVISLGRDRKAGGQGQDADLRSE
ncbi:type II secretion system major pseudopilin GspG [Rhizobium sp. MHM7A]|uniref:type II secretion system major pseudopilin GspG n=1 Tax=Rhizobium sp. MHM7A TaxID=2583233 RepID=UPI0011074E7C|nr:type II secretion system major pseudopilin GspG [Rhizobium sp. MHM7A]TLX12218.1 type II secretion system protein GspG [Rhizobium sp. MHM7A]